MKILDVMWFGGGTGCVGIVRTEDEYDGIKYYIGKADGHDEAVDTKHIADWGSTFPTAAGDVLFGVKFYE